MREVIDIAAQVSAEAIEAVLVGIEFGLIAEMPFAEDPGGVPGFLKLPRETDLCVRGESVVAGAGSGNDFGDAAALLIASGHQPRAGGTTNGPAGMEIGEADAARGEAVEIRRPNVGVAVAAHVAVAEIVGENQQNVRPARGSGQRGGGGAEEKPPAGH